MRKQTHARWIPLPIWRQKRAAMFKVCTWKVPDGVLKIAAWRNHYRKCLSSHYQSYPSNRLKLIDWNFKWVLASVDKNLPWKTSKEERGKRSEIDTVEAFAVVECDASFSSRFSYTVEKGKIFSCFDFCCEWENSGKNEKDAFAASKGKRTEKHTRWKSMIKSQRKGSVLCLRTMSNSFPNFTLRTVIYNRSHEKITSKSFFLGRLAIKIR